VETTLTFAIVIIAVALVFDFANGWHDSANSIATVVSTRVLTPFQGVLWAAFFNFVAFALLGTRVGKNDRYRPRRHPTDRPQWQLWVLLCGLFGAIAGTSSVGIWGCQPAPLMRWSAVTEALQLRHIMAVAGMLIPSGWD